MPPDTSIEVVPSEDGNIPAEAPTAPSEQPTTETPTETPEVVATATPEPELFELPDGRKVDALTLSKEWKENFYPDYTRKSQALAAKEEPITNQPAQNPLADPNYVPQTYEELANQIKQQTLDAIAQQQQETLNQQQAIEDAVSAQLTELKTAEPTLNENALFLHATKYGFRDLKLAHQNMKDMSNLAKNVQKTTADNIQKRNDPVSIQPNSSGGAVPDRTSFATATDFLRSLKT